MSTKVSSAEFSAARDLPSVYSLLDKAGMGPGWNKPEPSLWPIPKKTFQPAHWSYDSARAALDAAAPHIPMELAERRNLILHNPVPGNTYATARTLVAAYQMVNPGEVARSHRHTPNALRLVVDASPGMYTVVQGKKIPMAPGDVLLTPNWAWHGHANESGKAAYWIDFLDAPLVQLLEPMFFEHFPDGVEKPSGVDENSPMRFPVVETMTRLDEVEARHHNDDDAPLEIELGKPALDTIGLFVRRLRAGTKTKPIQTTANNIFGVIDGTGETDVDGEIIKWKRGDVFVAPAWRAFSHTADGKAHILRVTDEPVLTRLNLLHGH